MEITSNFDRFDKHGAQAWLLQATQFFGDRFFVRKILLPPEIDLQFRLDEAGEQKYRQSRSGGDADGSSISQYSFGNDCQKQA